jgi:hypothetical protein
MVRDKHPPRWDDPESPFSRAHYQTLRVLLHRQGGYRGRGGIQSIIIPERHASRRKPMQLLVSSWKRYCPVVHDCLYDG